MARDPIPTHCFALVVVRLGHRFLLVHEQKHGGGWYLPAGRVEPGESFAEAVVRECLEESGIPIHLDGILRVEHTPTPSFSRMRVIFLASPTDDTPPRTTPNEHTDGARWVTLAEAAALPLRSPAVLDLFAHVQRGAMVMPLHMLTAEGRW